MYISILQRHLHTHDYFSTIHNIHIVESTQDTEDMAYIHTGDLFCHKQEWNYSSRKMDGTSDHKWVIIKPDADK